ncbi:MAG: ankyrin repeat domain-containing protein [Alphaproteobacteria bacterium]|nr:ankyrin repeat domain-containing protein [Alphaproteobacteria bacterium]
MPLDYIVVLGPRHSRELVEYYKRQAESEGSSILVIGDGEENIQPDKLVTTLAELPTTELTDNTIIHFHTHADPSSPERASRSDLLLHIDYRTPYTTEEIFRRIGDRLQRPVNIHIWSCFSGIAAHDVEHLPLGSTLTTHSDPAYHSVTELNSAALGHNLKKTRGAFPLHNPIVRHIDSICSNPSTFLSFAINVGAKRSAFISEVTELEYSTEELLKHQRREIEKFKKYIGSIRRDSVKGCASLMEQLSDFDEFKVRLREDIVKKPPPFIVQLQEDTINDYQVALLIAKGSQCAEILGDPERDEEAAKSLNAKRAVEKLVTNGTLKLRNPYGVTPLYATCIGGNPKAIRFIARKARDSVNFQDSQGRVALHAACVQNHLPAVRVLLECGADPNIFDRESGITPLHISCRNRSPEIALCLLSNHADPEVVDAEKQTPLELTEAQDQTFIVKLLELARKDINTRVIDILAHQKVNLAALDEEGLPQMHYACGYESQIPVIQSFLRNGVSLETQDRFKRTPLHMAAGYSEPEVLRFLINEGANIHALDDEELTPLAVARSIIENTESTAVQKEKMIEVIELLEDASERAQRVEAAPEHEEEVLQGEEMQQIVETLREELSSEEGSSGEEQEAGVRKVQKKKKGGEKGPL